MSTPTHPTPSLVVVAGPNGAGKSTTAEALLVDTLAVEEFVNADVIARGLSGFAPGAAAVAAGRILLQRIRTLAQQRASFAFETTLASRSFAPWLVRLKSTGYRIHVVYFSLPSVELAVMRVRQRVRSGGHDVPEETIRRRYERGLRNLFTPYRPLATSWHVYDNGAPAGPRLVARGRQGTADEVIDATVWSTIEVQGRAREHP